MKCGNSTRHSNSDAVALLIAKNFRDVWYPLILMCQVCMDRTQRIIGLSDHMYDAVHIPEIPTLELLL